jgi:hypothetical protein
VTALVFAVITISTITAVIFSSGKTMLLANMPLIFLALLKDMRFELKKQRLGVDSVVLFTFLYLFFFGFAFITSIDWVDGSLRFAHYDSSFYARLVDYLAETGRENYYMDVVYPDQRPMKLYHYTEHWFAVFIKSIEANASGLILFEFVVNPILYSLCATCLLAVVKTEKVNFGWALAIVLFGLSGFVAVELKRVIPEWVPVDILRGWAPLSYPKITIAVICMTLIFRAFRAERLETVIFYSSLLVVNYITYFPAVLSFCLLLVAFHVATRPLSFHSLTRIGIVFFVLGPSFTIWGFVSPHDPCVIPRTPVDLIVETILDHSVQIAVSNSLYLLISFLPILLLLLLLGVSMNDFGAVALTACIVLCSVFTASIMCFHDQSFQVFQNVSLPILNILFAIIVGRSWSSLSKLRVGILLLILTSVFVWRTKNKVSYVSFDTLRQADKFFEGSKSFRTGFIRSEQSLSSLHGKYPSLNPPGQWICGMYSGYFPSSINELSWTPKESLHRSKELEYRCNSPFYLFVDNRVGTEFTIEELQRSFLRENDIEFIEVENGSRFLQRLTLEPKDSLCLDNGTIIYRL